MRRFLVAGNWKMNTVSESARSLAQSLAQSAGEERPAVEVLVCPPFPYLTTVKAALDPSAVALGAQDVYHESPGAFTGEVAAEMLVDVGCSYVILGHSERRHVLGETDETIAKKVVKALDAGLKVVLCVGELLSEREANETEAVLDRQLQGALGTLPADRAGAVVIAYEPVWAIGTGKTATPDQAQAAHAHIRNWIDSHWGAAVAAEMRILYGGSVKPDNAATLLAQTDVDGALVGGASLDAGSFQAIIDAAEQVAAG